MCCRWVSVFSQASRLSAYGSRRRLWRSSGFDVIKDPIRLKAGWAPEVRGRAMLSEDYHFLLPVCFLSAKQLCSGAIQKQQKVVTTLHPLPPSLSPNSHTVHLFPPTVNVCEDVTLSFLKLSTPKQTSEDVAFVPAGLVYWRHNKDA